MSAPDTISNVVSSVASMSEMEYVYLLFKLGGIAVGIVTTGAGAITTLYFGASWAWKRLLKSIKSSLTGTFCTPKEMEDCKVDQQKQLKDAIDTLTLLVVQGFARGQERMDQLQTGQMELAVGQRHTTKRVDSLFVALANEEIPSEPPADSEVPSDGHFFEPQEGSMPDGP